eukprot:COSAG03_NODE_7026_length_974_cov_2.414857_1_plen_173_part_00
MFTCNNYIQYFHASFTFVHTVYGGQVSQRWHSTQSGAGRPRTAGVPLSGLSGCLCLAVSLFLCLCLSVCVCVCLPVSGSLALSLTYTPCLEYQTVNIRDLPVREYMVTANYRACSHALITFCLCLRLRLRLRLCLCLYGASRCCLTANEPYCRSHRDQAGLGRRTYCTQRSN